MRILKRMLMVVAVAALMAVMLSVSAPLVFADPKPKPDDQKTLCKDNGYLDVVGVLGDGVTTFADQGECVSFVEELGGDLFPREVG